MRTQLKRRLSAPFVLLSRLREGYRFSNVANFKSRKPADTDVLTQLADLGRAQLRDGLCLVLDEGLLVKADLLLELLHLSRNHLFGDLRGLAAGHGLRQINLLLASVVCRRDVFLANVLRVAGRDVHGDIVHQFFEVFGASDEIALAVDLNQHADLASGMNVAGDRPLAGHTGSLLGRYRDAFLAEKNDGL